MESKKYLKFNHKIYVIKKKILYILSKMTNKDKICVCLYIYI